MHHGDIGPGIAAGLLALRRRIDEARVPSSKLDETINVAVWNIRDFGRRPRSQAAIHYIAEILGQFDLIALVELRDNLDDLGRVLPILGRYWDVVYSDWGGDRGANDERTAFLYDRRAVIFNGLAAEVSPPRRKQGTEYLALQSFWRPPYMCSFRSGNFDFVSLATHTRWGSSTEGRRAELQLLADWVDQRVRDQFVEDRDLIVMGDFNVPEIGDALFAALTSRGLQVPEVLRTLRAGDQVIGGTNLGGTARYDQILHLPTLMERFTDCGGTLDFFQSDAHIEELFPGQGLSRQQFSYELSDHLPLWVQIKTDIDGERFTKIVYNDR
jgi:hypothetical protein